MNIFINFGYKKYHKIQIWIFFRSQDNMTSSALSIITAAQIIAV